MASPEELTGAGGMPRLPFILLLANFLIAWMESFPMVAMQSLMINELHMSVGTVTYFYAVAFLPFMWKPLFGWVSDTWPIFGRRRVPYIVLSGLGCSAFLLLTATSVYTVPLLFLTTFLRDVCNAFLALMVDAFLIDIARLDLPCAAGLQGQANAAKWVGTLTSQLLALGIYTFSGGSGSGAAVQLARPLLAATAVAPALLSLLALRLPEELVQGAGARRRADEGGRTSAGLRFGFITAVAQANFVLIGCQSLMDTQTWWCSVIGLAVVSVLVLLLLHSLVGRKPRMLLPGPASDSAEEALAAAESGRSAQSDEALQCLRWPSVCLFCFLVSAIPNSSIALQQFQYQVFAAEGVQTLSIAASAASLVASLLFGRGFNRWAVRPMFAAATLVAILVALAPLPFVYRASGSRAESIWSTLGAWGLGSTVLGGVASTLSVLPIDTLVTSVSGGFDVRTSSTAYAIMLGLYSFGGTVSGVLAASALRVLGLDGKDWSALPHWIWIASLFKLAVFPLLLLVPRDADAAPRSEIRGEAGRGGNDDNEAVPSRRQSATATESLSK